MVVTKLWNVMFHGVINMLEEIYIGGSIECFDNRKIGGAAKIIKLFGCKYYIFEVGFL